MGKRFKNIFRYLRTPDGEINANMDASAAPVELSFEADDKCSLARIVVYLATPGRLAAGDYGSIGGGLENGLQLEHEGKVTTDLLDGVPIKVNADWAALCYDTRELQFSGGGDQALAVRWTFANSGKPLAFNKGDRLVVRVNDNLKSLRAHRFQVQGFYR